MRGSRLARPCARGREGERATTDQFRPRLFGRYGSALPEGRVARLDQKAEPGLERHPDIEPHMAKPALALRRGPYGPVPDAKVLYLGAVGSVPPGMGIRPCSI